MAKEKLSEIVSGVVVIIFLVYLVNFLADELGQNAFINPNLFIFALFVLLIVFLFEVFRRLKDLI